MDIFLVLHTSLLSYTLTRMLSHMNASCKGEWEMFWFPITQPKMGSAIISLRENRHWEQVVVSIIACEKIFCLLYTNDTDENKHPQLSGKQDFFFFLMTKLVVNSDVPFWNRMMVSV